MFGTSSSMPRVTCSCRAHGTFLTAKGLEEAAQRRLELPDDLVVDESLLYLDKVDSVSGARRDETHHVWDDQILDEQHARFSELL